MIVDPRYFFGRGEQLDLVFEKLNARQPQSCNVLGEHRIGRSSFLYRVKTIAPERLTNPNAFVFAYLDLQADNFVAPDGFRREALKQLGVEGLPAKLIDASQFDDHLTKLRAQTGKTPVLLLDEFESLLEPARKFDANFFDGLRSRASSGALVYIIATQKPLRDIERTTTQLSKLYTVCDTRVQLGNLTQDEARVLLSQPSDYPLNQEQVDLALIWAEEPHPLKLNLAAHEIYARLAANKGGWGADSANAAKEAYIERRDGILKAQKRDSERFPRSWGAWFSAHLWDQKVVKASLTAVFLFLLGLFILHFLGVINLEQARLAVLQKVGVPPLPSPNPVLTPNP